MTEKATIDLPTECGIPSERYRTFIEDVADGFFETDLKGNFLFFNNALCRILGYPRKDLQNRNYRDFMDDVNADIANKSFNQVYRTGRKMTGIIWRIIRQDGQQRILEISAGLIRDQDGRKAGFRGIARDITEPYTYQEKLEASEQRYRAFLEFLPDPVFVFNLDNTVSYLNPAFEKTFGWKLSEVEGKRIPFVPESEIEKTRRGIKRLLRDKVIHNFETRRLTKDGRLLDIIIDGAVFYDIRNQPAGQVITLRDVTRSKRDQRINNALFRISQALHRFRHLYDLLDYVAKEIQDLMGVGGASVILIDEEKKEFFFPVAAFEDKEAGQKFREIRFPLEKGVAGQVYRTGKPLMVKDYQSSPYAFQLVDRQTAYHTRNMLDVPLRIKDRMIGVLCAVNKKDGEFNDQDVELLTTIAGVVALPIENARINSALKRSYERVRELNRAKDKVIHHLSHELKTPLAVLSASIELLEKRIGGREKEGLRKVFARIHRSLDRLLEMQYEIEDILRERDYRTRDMLHMLLDTCRDLLETLIEQGVDSGKAAETIGKRIEELFGPRLAEPVIIDLGRFVRNRIEALGRHLERRRVKLETDLPARAFVRIPEEVITKIFDGLLRNAVENTPDEGLVEVRLKQFNGKVSLEVRDYGIGMTEEKQRLLFGGYFTAYETMSYSSKARFDFNAGGRGFDLLRMKIFSELYGFRIEIDSTRCKFLPSDTDVCPGIINNCLHCETPEDCYRSGGTMVRVTFKAAAEDVRGGQER